MITARKLGVTFPHGTNNREVLHDVSFEIKGSFVTAVGPSGCGKTTLLRLLGGLLKPTIGEIHWDNEIDNQISIVFQDYSLLPWLNARRNIELALEIDGADDAHKRAVSDRLLGELGLEHAADSLPYQLSGGMRQRVAIGRAFAQDAQLLLLDEPFGALDAITRMELQSVLSRMYEKTACGIFLVTHDIEEALFLSDEILVMNGAPTSIVKRIRVPFARPRPSELRWSERFVTLRREIMSALHCDTQQIEANVEKRDDVGMGGG